MKIVKRKWEWLSLCPAIHLKNVLREESKVSWPTEVENIFRGNLERAATYEALIPTCSFSFSLSLSFFSLSFPLFLSFSSQQQQNFFVSFFLFVCLMFFFFMQKSVSCFRPKAFFIVSCLVESVFSISNQLISKALIFSLTRSKWGFFFQKHFFILFKCWKS
jgi:hypothetical protein